MSARRTRSSIRATASSAQALVAGWMGVDMSSSLLSRPTSSALMGKQTAVLKTSVTDEVRDEFERFARTRGYASSSDCLRELVLVGVYGPQYLADLHRKRIESLVPSAAEIGTDAGGS